LQPLSFQLFHRYSVYSIKLMPTVSVSESPSPQGD
jgi:hypothetical protein